MSRNYPRGRFFNNETNEEILDMRELLIRMERFPCCDCGGKSGQAFLYLPEDTKETVVEPIIPSCKSCIDRAVKQFEAEHPDEEDLYTIKLYKESRKPAMMLRFEPGLVYVTNMRRYEAEEIKNQGVPISFPNDNPGTFEVTEEKHIHWAFRRAYFHIFDSGKMLVMAQKDQASHEVINIINKVDWDNWTEMLEVLRYELLDDNPSETVKLRSKWVKEIIYWRFDDWKKQESKKRNLIGRLDGLMSLFGGGEEGPMSQETAELMSQLMGIPAEELAKAGTNECNCASCVARREAAKAEDPSNTPG